jgi:hypothetical protein
MSDDMIKKSVDITQEDEEWLEENPINFSKWVRTKLAEERANQIPRRKKEALYHQVEKMISTAEDLRDDWKEERQELQEEYGCEVLETNYTHWIFEHDGEQYTAHWIPDNPFAGIPEEIRDGMPEEAKDFGKEFVDGWFDRLDQFEDFVEAETGFEIVGGDESTQTLEGSGFMEEFKLYMEYLTTNIGSVRVRFLDRETYDISKFEPREKTV